MAVNQLELAKASLARTERNIRRGEAFVRAQTTLALQTQALIARLTEKQAEIDRAGQVSTEEISEHERKRANAVERIARLSRREREVLEGLIAGKPNKVIAFDLNISPRTVEVYRANVMQKMQVASLPTLVRLALLANESA